MAGDLWDAPNQQVVRADASAPWEEGSGGEGLEITPTLDEMTKAELLQVAADRGVGADSSMSKAEILAALGGGGG